MPVEPLEEFSQKHAPAIDRLYARSRADRWGVPKPAFAAALHRSAATHFRHQTKTSAWNIEGYLNELHAEDLGLACACSLGREHAWLQFMNQHRNALRVAARALVRDEAQSIELADSAYGELYGAKGERGRTSLLEYYHGRSSLSTWLHAVVARMWVNEWRSKERERARAEGVANEAATAPPPPEMPDPDRRLYLESLREALNGALGALEARDRLRISYYYLQDLSLAHIGRLMGEHESTVSRKLARTRGDLKKHVERILRTEKNLSREQIQQSYEYAVDGWPFDLSGAFVDANPGKEKPAAAFQDVETPDEA